MKGFFIVSLLLVGLTYTSGKSNNNFAEKDEVKAATAGWQNPDTCLGSCPARNPVNRVIIFQNKDCTKYCICNDGTSVVNVCPHGLHFSLKDQVCTWPLEANCEDKTLFYNLNSLEILENERVEVTTEAWRNPETCKGYCPEKDPADKTILLENNDCTKYCSCSNGEPIVNHCPKGLHFSLKKQTCTWPRDAKCPQYPYNSLYDWLLSPKGY